MRCDERGHCVADAAAAAAPVQRGSTQLDEPPPDAGAYEHDGFLARVTLGPAFAAIAQQADIALLDAGVPRMQRLALDVSGAGLALGVDIGFSMGARFAWHVRLSQCVVPDPQSDGESPEGRGDASRTLALLGPGLSYFGPFGFYAAAAVGVAFTRTQSYEGQSGLGDAGLGANLDLGLETWVGEQFGLGGALRGWWSDTSGDDADGGRSQRALAAAVLLSLTYH